jgi:Asp/Glu/hydantoin racemase
MKAIVGVLHTSLIFVTAEPMVRELFQELLPDARVADLVDGDLLATVQREMAISTESVQRMCHLARAAEAAGADAMFSLCSSLGPAIDVARNLTRVPIVKIDDAMARAAVSSARRIGVLATVPSTVVPSTDLVQAHAREAGRDVTVTSYLCEGALSILMGGDRERHDEMVIEGARALSSEVDVIILAQASMARLEARISAETGMNVLASPRRGVEELVRVLSEPAAGA